MLTASLIMGAVSMRVHTWLLPPSTHVSVAFEALVLGLSIGVALATLYGMCRLMRIEELDVARAAVREKLARILGKA